MADERDEDRPARLRAEWLGERRWQKSEFPTGYPGAPVLSRRVVETFGDELSAAGSLVPVEIAGAKNDEYFLYVVEQVVDCPGSAQVIQVRRGCTGRSGSRCSASKHCRTDCRPSACGNFPVPSTGTAVRPTGSSISRVMRSSGVCRKGGLWRASGSGRAPRGGRVTGDGLHAVDGVLA